ncbi:MAG: hypothetical protein RLZZ231_851 [Bacteroidota bacterium]|jgi:hypothetical protein
MKNFQVLVIAHCLKGNKIAKSGDIVSESQLTSPAFELIEAGFIKEVVQDVNEVETVEENVSADVEKEIKEIKKPVKKTN